VKDSRGGHDGVVFEALSHSDVKLVLSSLWIADEKSQWQKHSTIKTNEDHRGPDEDSLQVEFQNSKVEEEDTEFGENKA